MANPNFSKEELSCIAEVQKAPEWQQKLAFEQACKNIWNKTRIALLAATLGLTNPVMANDTENTNPNYQAFYTQIVERYPKLFPEQHYFFARAVHFL